MSIFERFRPRPEHYLIPFRPLGEHFRAAGTLEAQRVWDILRYDEESKHHAGPCEVRVRADSGQRVFDGQLLVWGASARLTFQKEGVDISLQSPGEDLERGVDWGVGDDGLKFTLSRQPKETTAVLRPYEVAFGFAARVEEITGGRVRIAPKSR